MNDGVELHTCTACGEERAMPLAPAGQVNFCKCPKCGKPMQPPLPNIVMDRPNH